MPRRLEPAHDFISQSGRLMRVLRAVVESLMLPVLNSGHDLGFRRTVTLQLIRDDHARHVPQAFE